MGLQGATSLTAVLPAETGPGLRLIVYNILKEKVDFIIVTVTSGQKVAAAAAGEGRGRENVTCIKFSQMNIVTQNVLY